jgi:fructokinase
MPSISPVLVGGEALYDLISTTPGAGLGGTKTFEKRAGGSPFNIAVGVRRLGTPVAFVGKFGDDQFGEALVQFLKNEKIDVDLIVREPETKTTLAFVAVEAAGKVDFRFYRDHAADTSLQATELKPFDPRKFSLYHCGGIVLAEEPTASAYISIVDRFMELGVPVSLDPTIRKSLIADEETYLNRIRRLAEKVNVLKLSDEELTYLTGISDTSRAVRALRVSAGALVIITLGSQGAEVYRDSQRLARVPGFSVKVVETTGCGDSFMAATLAQLAGRTPKEVAGLSPEQLEPIARFANAAAAIVATRYGAAEANPNRKEVEAFLAQSSASSSQLA